MNRILTFTLLIFLTGFSPVIAQQITGTWRGKIDNKRVELKIIQKGDSLAGTSYYYGLTSSHKRYSIKGYFDSNDNSVVWWDDELITSNGGEAVSNSLRSIADFNCPGGNRMYLDGKTSKKDEPANATGKVNLTKVGSPNFHDEWDFVIDNYPTGGNNPYIIDSVSRIATARKMAPVPHVILPPKPEPEIARRQPAIKQPIVEKEDIRKAVPQKTIDVKATPAKPVKIDELFALRKKIIAGELPIEGDSIRLNFYDNAEVDGDSISVYLNDKMIFTHVQLTAKAYVITLPVDELSDKNELVMVAENLGAIPPNTALMIATIAGKRYETYLESTEGSSSVIKFTRKK